MNNRNIQPLVHAHHDHRKPTQTHALHSPPNPLPHAQAQTQPQSQPHPQYHRPQPMYGHGAVVNTVPGGIVIDQRRYDPRQLPSKLPPVSKLVPASDDRRERPRDPTYHLQAERHGSSFLIPNAGMSFHDHSSRRTPEVMALHNKVRAFSQPAGSECGDIARVIKIPESPVVQALHRVWKSLEELHRKVDEAGELGKRNAEELQSLRVEIEALMERSAKVAEGKDERYEANVYGDEDRSLDEEMAVDGRSGGELIDVG